MNWKKLASIAKWVWENHQALIAAGTEAVPFGVFLADAIRKLFAKAETPDAITREMLAELAAEWPGALPPAEDIFDPILLEE